MPKKTPKNIDIYVGHRLRMRRLMLGLSQVKLGSLLGVSFQQLQKYEKGANRIGASGLQQMAEILGVPVSFFFDGIPETRKHEQESPAMAATPDYIARFLATAQGLALSKAFMDIDDPILRRRVVNLVEEIASFRQSLS
jgi:transcriptional regulator with XRE-family HTH domain